MRTYAPAATESVLADLLDEPSLARGVVHHAVHSGPRGRVRIVSTVARSADPSRPGRAWHRPALHPPGRCGRGGPRRPGHRRRHADRVRQDAVLRPARPPGDRGRPRGPCPVPLPHQGARAGPGRGIRGAVAGGGHVDLGGDVRRRHARRHPLRRPQGGSGRRQQSGHAELRDPAPPHEVVPAVRAAAGDRHRRAPYLPRGLREPRRQRHPAAAAAVPPLRQQPGHRLLLGDDREPDGTGRAVDGTAGPTDRSQRGAGGRAPRAARRPAHPRRRDGGARIAADPGEPLGVAVPASRPPDGGVRPIARRDRDSVDGPARGAPRELRPADTGPRLSRAAISRPNGGPSSKGCGPARSSASSRRMRSSSASTSAGWTRRCWPAIPGSIAATWQQIGRAGRRSGTSVAVLVASQAPIDQYVIHHPEFLLGGSPEEARLDPDNLHVLLAHVRAATFELPFEPGEVFGPGPPTICSRSSRRRATSARRATGGGTGARRTSRPRRSRCGRPPRRTS